MSRILVCGDRNWTDREAIRRELATLPAGSVIIEGECPTKINADKLAREVAEELGFDVEPYEAEWHRYGRAAGPIRNERMLKEGRPDECWAFHPDLAKSKGTRDMVNQASRAKIIVRVFSE